MSPPGSGPSDGGGPADGGANGPAGTDSPDDPGAGPSGGGQNRSGPPSIGPLAVEAALLLDVVADRLTSLRPAGESDAGEPPSGTPQAAPPDPPPTPTSPPSAARTAPPSQARPEPTLGPDGRCPECGSVPGASCTACPLCRFLAVLRGERPEATARLVDGALLIVRTLRSLLPEAEPAAAATGGATAGDHRPPGPSPSSARRPGGLEHIDIR